MATMSGTVSVDGESIPYLSLFDEPIAPKTREQIATFLNFCFARALLEENLDRRLREAASITLAQHEVLYRLSLAPGGRLCMAELADILLTSRSGASRLVDRMVSANLVERESSSTDRRLVYAVLTEDGKKALVRSSPVFKTGVTEVFGDILNKEDHVALRQILRKLLAAQGGWDIRRCEPPAFPTLPSPTPSTTQGI